MTATHAVKVRPATASAWFYVRDRWLAGRRTLAIAGTEPELTTHRRHAGLIYGATAAAAIAAEIERDNPGTSAKAVPLFAGRGRSL